MGPRLTGVNLLRCSRRSMDLALQLWAAARLVYGARHVATSGVLAGESASGILGRVVRWRSYSSQHVTTASLFASSILAHCRRVLSTHGSGQRAWIQTVLGLQGGN